MKVNIYSRDRRGGHQPAALSLPDGIVSHTQAGRKFSKKVHVRALRREAKKATEQALLWWHIEQEQEAQEAQEIGADLYDSDEDWQEVLRPAPEYPYYYDDYGYQFDYASHFTDMASEFDHKSDYEVGYEDGYRRASRSGPDTLKICLHKWHKVQELIGLDSKTLLNYFTRSGVRVELT